ncbi:SusC/RagA family TonB-linked outer membrane protein [Flavivirga abyssicola]|uniref:SusC/RagA family TonB-linked outer membrane protein n=1 Tax=Flavivirga abyssicola TaxID=3063533 RepID=UPI0026E0290D|nr:SusC/RagA family TonB-linked outer membrane protein [Flavivirga sp. MEBiC07777]WVK14750.1 SusC/RagA family TonB-linked outer membrane protein [Flavivirga sp. MEBiC07777]
MKKTFKNTGRVCFLLLNPDLKMKLTYFFFLISFFQIYASSFGQNVKVSLDLDNVTVEKAFDEIENMTDYRFLYNIKSVNLNRKISISTDKEPLYMVLKRLFKSTNVKFKILENQIVLKVEPQKPQEAVQKSISGIITDENNIPLAGVTVLISGTQKGTISDFDGKYSIQASKGNFLVFSYLGYLDAEVEITEEDTYHVKMIPTTLDLDSVNLVYTGYQAIEKERVTGSFGRVKQEILENKIDQNILSKISDEIPGILFSQNNGIIVRGLSSINASTAPLIVVDGLPTELSISNINPNDVESISVLRDAAAASIWGIRAANGVIVIVTKKGSRNAKTLIEASLNLGITEKQDLFDNNLGDTSTQINYQRALFETQNDNYGIQELFTGDNVFRARELFQLDPVIETLLLQERGDLTQSQVNALLNQFSLRDVRREYSKKVLRQPIWNQYNLAISGGSEKQDYRASITFNTNQNNTISNNSNQFISNFRNSLDITDKLKARFIVNFSQIRQNLPPNDPNDGISLLDRGISPTAFLGNFAFTNRLLEADGSYFPMVGGASNAFSQFLQSRGALYPFTYNLLQEYDNANNELNRVALRLQAAVDYEIYKDLDLSLTYQYELGATEQRNLYNENTFVTRSRVNLFSQIDRATSTVTDFPIPQGSILDVSLGKQISHAFRGQFNYDASFNNALHKITAIAGYEARLTINEVDRDRRYGFDNQTLLSIDPDFRTNYRNFYSDVVLTSNQRIPSLARGAFVENRFISYFANLGYTFNDNYTISASTRLDDTNLFGASKEFRNVPLYSIGAKWNISNDLFPIHDIFNDLQLRASFGTNGNVDRSAGPFLQASIFQQNGAFINRAATISNLPNPLLRLEKTKTINVGLDFGIFNNVLEGSIEYYKSNSEDLLADVALNPTLGVSQFLLNAGELSNEGLDIRLNLNLGTDKGFLYGSTFNLSINENKLTKVDIDQDRISSYINGSATIQGEALSTIYSYRYANLDKNGAPQFLNRNNEILDFNFTSPNVTSDTFTVSDLKREGTLIPKYYGSWINNFSYNNFTLRAITNFRAGHVFRYTDNGFGAVQTYIPGGRNAIINVANDFNQRWQNPGDENITSIPAVPSAGNANSIGYQNYPFINRFVDDASHIRLSQVSLIYALPSKFLKKIKLNSLKMGLQLDNVYVWDFNKWNVDPGNTLIPLPRTLTLNLNASF